MICAIVLAAGQSRRMGTQKLLLDYGSKSVISHIVDQLLGSAIDQVCVVTGADGDRVADEIVGSGVSVIFNEGYKAGMLSSVRCGLSAIEPDCRAVVIALGDQPAISSKLVDELLGAYKRTDRTIVIPTYKGRRGHPIVMSAQYKDEVMTCYDDVGLRGLMHAHPDQVLELPVSTPNVCMDMDEPSDYSRAIDALSKDKQEESG